MSVTLYIELRDADERLRESMPSDIKHSYMIPWAIDELDVLATKLGLAPIGSFVRADADILEEVEDDLGEEAAEYAESFAAVRAAQSRWHDPADALKTFRGLKAHFDAQPDVLETLAEENYRLDAEELLEEMDAFIANLEFLVAKDVPFCFRMD